jgi:hypothetical protein
VTVLAIVGAAVGAAAVLAGALVLFGRREQRRQRRIAAQWADLDEASDDEVREL